MAVRIVSDSSANLATKAAENYYSVPMTIRSEEKEYMDDENLDVFAMLDEIADLGGKTGTACPAPGQFVESFGDSEEVIAITITSALSGCYNAALSAKEIYEEEHPEARVYVLDTKSTGPEEELIVEEAKSLSTMDIDFDSKCRMLRGYARTTHLAFMLSSLDNFVRNGRVSPALGKVVTLLNIRIVGRASEGGELEPQNKCRGDRNGIAQLWKNMKTEGYSGGRVRIRHTKYRKCAEELRRMILEEFPEADVTIHRNHGLCSYYAEVGGILVGYEGN